MAKWLIKTCLSAVIWVFVFSMEVQGRTLFSYANEYLVQNSVVQGLDDELGKLWSKVSETARLAFSSDSKPELPKATM